MSDKWRAPLYRSFRVSLLERAEEIVHSFSASGRVLFYALAVLIALSSLALLGLLNNALTVEVPTHGGSYTEGIIGTPRFINPVLAISDADHDMTALVYSGLLKASQSGSFIPDLATHYDISGDGKTYTVYIRPDAKFQNGMPVSADDVVFTVQKALDPTIKSPLLANWNGVQVSELDAYTVQFTLTKPYAPFIQNLTLGILPKALWQNVSAEEFPFSELNTMPIGSGPYAVLGVERTSSGVPAAYHLSSFSNYALGEPYIRTMTFRFYENEQDVVSALKSGSIEAASGISPVSLPELKGFNILSTPIGRVFGVFFNQNQNAVLQNGTVRAALSQAIDRQALIRTVLSGYGSAVEGPVPPSLAGEGAAASTTAASTSTPNVVALAHAELIAAGWQEGPDKVLEKSSGTGKSARSTQLALTISTGDVPELQAAANFAADAWRNMGAKVSVQVFAQGDLSENVIRPRKYDALLFGEIIGQGLDLFAFWDSSQRNDPGLNIALYANSTVDSLLAQLRQTSDNGEQEALYKKIASQIESDHPAVFLYSPDFVYVVPKDLKGIRLGFVENPSDRFETVQSWYRQTDHVWEFFAK